MSAERTFVQAALCRMSSFATIADHKERFISSFDELANDVCNEGFYAMLQMYVYEDSQYEELTWDHEAAQLDKTHLECMRGCKHILENLIPVKAKTRDLFMFQVFQELVCDKVSEFNDELSGTTILTKYGTC